ncbi:DNA repair protein RecN [candidate division FCPU426 bacterium]|nr:DNA repair protein RecN [candidate division FCPU426 bacterium]
MIIELTVRNISLIAELRLALDPGLNILTGETGAGKSILLGALSLLLGEKASGDIIRTGCETASVEAVWQAGTIPEVEALLEASGLPACEDQALIIKRMLSRNGRGKCFVNGSYTTLAVLQQIGDVLVDLHGQHEHQSLLHRSRQRDLLDAWGGLSELRARVAQAYEQLRRCREARERLTMDEAQRVRRLDMLDFQINEIAAARLQPGEGEVLNEERSRLQHAERLINNVQEALEILHRREGASAREGISLAADMLSDLSQYDTAMGGMADDLRSAEAAVADVVGRLADFADSFEADPGRLEAVEERLDVLGKLKRKYGAAEEDILAFHEQARRERESLAQQDEELERLAREEAQSAERLALAARALSAAREKAGTELARRLEKELLELGFKQAVFHIQVRPREDAQGWIAWDGKSYHCGPAGADEIEFGISPNPGEEVRPVSKIASGGELSRIMLAIKVIAAQASQVHTMVFDEVDAGIGGATAEAVGRKLNALSGQNQVVVISHLPQIARFAHRHFLVQKAVEHGRTATMVTGLDAEGRVREIARLMAGDQLTETALRHARELIEKK